MILAGTEVVYMTELFFLLLNLQSLFPQFKCTNFSFIACKKIVSNSPGLVDFAIGLVIFVLNLPDGQVVFWGEIQITEGL